MKIRRARPHRLFQQGVALVVEAEEGVEGVCALQSFGHLGQNGDSCLMTRKAITQACGRRFVQGVGAGRTMGVRSLRRLDGKFSRRYVHRHWGCACDAMVQNKGPIIPVNDPNPDEPRLARHA
jgi:hypothetical protein